MEALDQHPAGIVGCAAPSAALYFRPDGFVGACCATWHLLGRVTGPERESLEAIWRGRSAALQRESLARGDFSLGCWECGHAAAVGRRETSIAAGFDGFEPSDGYPTHIDFALSNRCNLACEMCNGGLSSTIRRTRERRPPLPAAYDDRFFEELVAFLPHLTSATFKGGEPFLAPENWRVWDLLLDADLRPEVSVTTNGTTLTPKVAAYVRELRMNVTVSVDAMDPELLGAIRVGVDPARLWRNVTRFQELAAEIDRPVTLAFCLMAQNWWELGPFLAEVERRGVEPSIIWVDGPRQFSVFSLPPAELVEVERHLDRLLATWSHGPRSRAILVDALARIRAHRSLTVQPATAVTLRAPAPSRDARELARERLHAECGPALVEIRYRDEVVESIEGQEWASWLEPASWLGSGLEEAITLLARGIGRPLRSQVDALEGGVHRGVFTVADADADADAEEARPLVSLYVPPDRGSATSWILIGQGPDTGVAPGAPGRPPKQVTTS